MHRNETHTIRGRWWIDNADEAIPGTLTLNPSEAASLELLGSFTDDIAAIKQLNIGTPAVHDAIFGVSVDNKLVTVLNAIQNGGTYRFGHGTSEACFSGLYCATGAHIDGLASEVRSIQVEVQGIGEWFGDRPFGMFHSSHERSTGANYECRPFAPLSARIGVPAMEVRIHSILEPRGVRLFKQLSLHPKYLLELTADDPKPLADWISILEWQRSLFSLLMGRQTDIISATTLADPPLFSLWWPKFHGDVEDLGQPQMLAPAPTVGALWQPLLDRWFQDYELLRLPVYLCLSSMHHELFIESQLATACQALEALHASIHSSTLIDTDTHRRLIDPVLAAIPHDAPRGWRESVARSIQNSNYVSLRRKLSTLLDALPPEASSLISTNHSRDVKRLLDFRNRISHGRRRFTHRDDFSNAYAALRFSQALCLLSILKHLGLDATEMARSISSAIHFQCLPRA